SYLESLSIYYAFVVFLRSAFLVFCLVGFGYFLDSLLDSFLVRSFVLHPSLYFLQNHLMNLILFHFLQNHLMGLMLFDCLLIRLMNVLSNLDHLNFGFLYFLVLYFHYRFDYYYSYSFFLFFFILAYSIIVSSLCQN